MQNPAIRKVNTHTSPNRHTVTKRFAKGLPFHQTQMSKQNTCKLVLNHHLMAWFTAIQRRNAMFLPFHCPSQQATVTAFISSCRSNMFEEVSNGHSHNWSFLMMIFHVKMLAVNMLLLSYFCSNKDLYKVQMSASFAFQRAHFVTLHDLTPVLILHYDLLQYTLWSSPQNYFNQSYNTYTVCFIMSNIYLY